MVYVPPQKILKNYAKVLVNFALNSGSGIKSGEVVFLQVPESAKPLLIELNKVVLESDAHPIIQYIPDEMMRDFFIYASEKQISFFPSAYLKGKVRQADHILSVIAETNKHELEGIDPRKIMEYNRAIKPYKDWREKKENANKFTWTLGLYATPAMAKEAGLTHQECWQQIIKACYLDHEDPIKSWKEAKNTINRYKNALNSLGITKLRIKSENTDLQIGINNSFRWLGGDGRNIPSFEIFVSPDWRLTEGHVSFDLPLYRYGHLIQGIYLEFKKGKISALKTEKGQEVLEEMIKVKNGNKLGEFSLTDKRLSRIDKFMAETLFDENYGGLHGNFHIALGSAYKESYFQDPSKMSNKQWGEVGLNQSVIHTDIVSTKESQVTAVLPGGKELIIYEDGKFLL